MAFLDKELHSRLPVEHADEAAELGAMDQGGIANA